MCLKINKSRRNFYSAEIELLSKNVSRRFATNKQTGRIHTVLELVRLVCQECRCG